MGFRVGSRVGFRVGFRVGSGLPWVQNKAALRLRQQDSCVR